MKKLLDILDKISEKCESLPAVIIGGIFLLASLIPHVMGIHLPLYANPAWIPAVISGFPVVYYAIYTLITGKGIGRITSALLITVAMIASIAIGDIFAAGEIAFIMAIGELLEEKTTAKARKGLKRLISIAPQQGRVIIDGREEMISAEEIKVGDVIRILPGETIPIDGEIISGQTSVDQSVITGESLPVDKEAGDDVFCGTINRFGAIDVRAARVGKDSSLQKLIRMIEEAEENKAPMQRTADRWASLLVPIAMIIAVIAGIAKQDIIVAVTVLVVFCPCALVLATPTAIMAAIGQATKYGVIIKSGEALEKMAGVDTAAFDKTGTLTYGRLEVCNVISIDESISENMLVALTASGESRSEHPLGKAITLYAQKNDIGLYEISDFSMKAGKGISATLDGRTLLCGNEKYMLENGIELSGKLKEKLELLRSEGKASVITALDGKAAGIIALSDVLREDAAQITDRLSAAGITPVLLTGDNRRTAEYFASESGITEIRAELLPEDKVANIRKLQEAGKSVCMTGDGVNDAPALKIADVGIAMGDMGSDIAVDAADIVLMNDDICNIPYIRRLASATVNTIRLSISLSLGINFLAIILSVLELLTPTTGALVHNAGSVLVVLIAALLYERKFR